MLLHSAARTSRNWRLGISVALLVGVGGGVYMAATEVARRAFIAPLAIPAAASLLQIETTSGDGGNPGLPGPALLALREAHLSYVAAVGGHHLAKMNERVEAAARVVDVVKVTAGFFEALGVIPIKGRVFNTEDELPGSEPVVIISYAAWQNRFGRAADVLERTLVLDGKSHRIVGVLPAGMDYPSELLELYVPANPRFTVSGRQVTVPYFEGLLRISGDRIPADLRAAVGRAINTPLDHVRVERVTTLLERQRRSAAVLFQIVSLVLLVTMGLAVIFIQGSSVLSRLDEHRIRIALGARPKHVVLSGLASGASIGLVAWLVALVVGFATLRVLASWSLGAAAFVSQGLSLPATLTGLLVILTLVSLTSCWVARQAYRWAAGEPARMWSRSLHPRGLAGSRDRYRRVAVAAQLAVGTFALVMFASVLVELAALSTLEWGIRPEADRIRLELRLSAGPQLSASDRAEAFERLATGLRDDDPGLQPVLVQWLPGDRRRAELVEVRGPEGASLMATNQVSTAGVELALGLKLVAGRVLDHRRGDRGAVISRSLAMALFGSEQRALDNALTISGAQWSVVGVVADVRETLVADHHPAVYRSLRNVADTASPTSNMLSTVDLLVRSSSNARSVRARVAAAAAEVAPALGFGPAEPVRTTLERLSDDVRGRARIAGAIAVACVLSAVISFVIGVRIELRERVPEMAMRLALGAQPWQLMQDVVARAGRLVVSGTGAGALLAYTGLQTLSSFGAMPVHSLAWPVATGTITMAFLGFASVVVSAALIARLRPADLLRTA
jgi:putative ABC transport system permease protein